MRWRGCNYPFFRFTFEIKAPVLTSAMIMNIQDHLFDRIRDQLPDHLSLVDEISEILGISIDSAYRRIRGEKLLSIVELKKLAEVFHLSLDDLLDTRSKTVTFNANFLQEGSYDFSNWLDNLMYFTKLTTSGDQSEAIFILNELNIFHLLQFPDLCAFKMFFWEKSNLNFTGLSQERFSREHYRDEIHRYSKEITEHYVQINTVEFTTREVLNSILKQILYYQEAGFFNSRDDAFYLCDQLHVLIDHQQKQAELGYKFPFGRAPLGKEGNLRVYHNDIILADNTIMVRSGEDIVTYLTSNAINLMQTYNRSFYEYNYQWGRNLLSKSIQISGAAEKERNRFFLQLREQIDSVRKQL
jgi:transcriptional regulator with XRE-family HTH domain